MNKRNLEEHSDQDLNRLYLIENIREHQKNAWSKPSNLIAIVSLSLSLILGALTFKLFESNESKSMVIKGQVEEIQEKKDSLNQKDAVLLSEKEKVLEAINAPKQSVLAGSDKDVLTDDASSLVAISKVISADRAKGGWMFLGKLDVDGIKWESGSPQTIKMIPYGKLNESIVEVIDDVYLRGDTGERWKSSEKVVDVALVGDRFRVQGIHISPVKGGGSFVWVKVDET